MASPLPHHWSNALPYILFGKVNTFAATLYFFWSAYGDYLGESINSLFGIWLAPYASLAPVIDHSMTEGFSEWTFLSFPMYFVLCLGETFVLLRHNQLQCFCTLCNVLNGIFRFFFITVIANAF